jgi:hypothetical protein
MAINKNASGKLISFGEKEVNVARGDNFKEVNDWIGKQFSKFVFSIDRNDYNTAKEIFEDVFVIRRDDFIRILTYARVYQRNSEAFLAEGFRLASRTMDPRIYDAVSSVTPNDFVNPRIWLAMATYACAIKNEGSVHNFLKMAVLCGIGANSIFTEENIRICKSEALEELIAEYSAYPAKLETAIRSGDLAMVELLLAPLETVSSLEIKGQSESKQYLILSAPWCLKDHPNKALAAQIMKLIISKTPQGIQGDALTILARHNENLSELSYLLENGVNPNTRARIDGWTAAGMAKLCKNSKIIAQLKISASACRS